MGRWEEIDHTADLALHLWADDLSALFITAARGMFSLIAAPREDATSRALEISLSALDVETLLVDWLNELLYLSEVESLVFTGYELAHLTPNALEATVTGRPIKMYYNYIKAATFHNLSVDATPDGYETEIVFDT
ncbi:MAG: archease [Chloroflexi bacterium]|jgi:SHS2 domain-containing protein|nr:archease [Chloroflexota bacterium]